VSQFGAKILIFFAVVFAASMALSKTLPPSCFREGEHFPTNQNLPVHCFDPGSVIEYSRKSDDISLVRMKLRTKDQFSSEYSGRKYSKEMWRECERFGTALIHELSRNPGFNQTKNSYIYRNDYKNFGIWFTKTRQADGFGIDLQPLYSRETMKMPDDPGPKNDSKFSTDENLSHLESISFIDPIVSQFLPADASPESTWNLNQGSIACGSDGNGNSRSFAGFSRENSSATQKLMFNLAKSATYVENCGADDSKKQLRMLPMRQFPKQRLKFRGRQKNKNEFELTCLETFLNDRMMSCKATDLKSKEAIQFRKNNKSFSEIEVLDLSHAHYTVGETNRNGFGVIEGQAAALFPDRAFLKIIERQAIINFPISLKSTFGESTKIEPVGEPLSKTSLEKMKALGTPCAVLLQDPGGSSGAKHTILGKGAK
jgi:hypothetical protein